MKKPSSTNRAPASSCAAAERISFGPSSAPRLRRQVLRKILKFAALRVMMFKAPNQQAFDFIFVQAQRQFGHTHGVAVRIGGTLGQGVAVLQRPEQIAPFQRRFAHARVVQSKALRPSQAYRIAAFSPPARKQSKQDQRRATQKQSDQRENKGNRAHSCRARFPSFPARQHWKPALPARARFPPLARGSIGSRHCRPG